VSEAAFVDLEADGRTISLEYAWVEPAHASPVNDAAMRGEAVDPPLVVFLHEGLGSLSMWKDYPQRLCDACGCRGLVFSRAGYGRSTPRRPEERWPVDFMHREAQRVLPRLFDRLGVGADGNRPWLLGHSDGGSIALIFAAAFPDGAAGVIAVAPHIFVEDVSIASIAAARDAYRATDLRARLARYHTDPDSAFFGWNDVWLDPAFRDWSIEAVLDRLQCPILAVQGEDDEYGTLAQVTGIHARVRHSEIVVLADCGHSPHRDQPEALTRAVADFIARHPKARANEGGVS
jgi:pimeloyl-ACP methyl ester carboxylesterase